MLEIGQIIDGKYKILNVIGKGGMSIVYLAMNEKANKQWAIKEVRKDGKQDFDVVKQGLVAEIDMLKRFNHPNLPSIVDVIDGDGTFLIVMDYIEGNALDKKLQEEGAQNQEDVIAWSKQLCDVLGYLHSRKPPIIYRDMKPSNIMLKPDGTVMLIDFGTAREFKYAGVADTTCLGTRGYAAPEQFGGQGQTDARTDIYCLGATMYHLVTGHNPGVYPYKMYPIRQWNNLLSSGLEEIILKCTQQNPEERYQTCAELMYALEHYQDLDAESKRSQNIKWRTFIATSALSLIMAGGAVGFKSLEKAKTADTYDNYLITASTAPPAEAYKLYDKAIELKPESSEAYFALLNYIDGDNSLTQSEHTKFKQLTDGTSDKKRKEAFKKADKDNYSLFCYDVGMAYFFDYSSSNGQDPMKEGARQSLVWFGEMDLDDLAKAAESDDRSDAENIKDKASVIYQMAKFRNSGTEFNSRGDQQYGYIDFWNDNLKLMDMDLENTNNATVALSFYTQFATTVYARADEFYYALKSVARDGELKEKLGEILEKAENIEHCTSYDPVKNPKQVENLEAMVASAMNAVEKTAAQKPSKGGAAQ